MPQQHVLMRRSPAEQKRHFRIRQQPRKRSNRAYFHASSQPMPYCCNPLQSVGLGRFEVRRCIYHSEISRTNAPCQSTRGRSIMVLSANTCTASRAQAFLNLSDCHAELQGASAVNVSRLKLHSNGAAQAVSGNRTDCVKRQRKSMRSLQVDLK
jgi:hypothetical protein